MVSQFKSNRMSNSFKNKTFIEKVERILEKSDSFVGDYFRYANNECYHDEFKLLNHCIVVDRTSKIGQTIKKINSLVLKEFHGKKCLSVSPFYDNFNYLGDDEANSKLLGAVNTIADTFKIWIDSEFESVNSKGTFELVDIQEGKVFITFKVKHIKRSAGDSSESFSDTTQLNSIFSEFMESFNLNTICETSKFGIVLILSIITLLGHFLYYAAEFSIKFIRELTNLLKVMTPIFYGFFDFLSKCIGGFYWLIYAIFSKLFSPQPAPIMMQPYNYSSIGSNSQNPRMIEYPSSYKFNSNERSSQNFSPNSSYSLNSRRQY